MLGDSDEVVDLTDPLRDADTDDYEGPVTLDLGSAAYSPTEEIGRVWPPDLHPDGGEWAATPWLGKVLLLAFAAAAAGFVAVLMLGKT